VATNYPGSLDTFDTIASDKKTSDSVGGRTHRDMHNDVADALEAVQAELGTDPAGTFATVKARLAAYDAYAAKTGAYTATVNDNTLDVTSGTFTLDLPAASTCTGKTLKIKNSGTGVVTLDGNSSETVEGVATFPLGRGSYVEITSTGTAWILTAGVADTGRRAIAIDGAGWSGTLNLRRIGSVCTLYTVGGATMPASGLTVLNATPTGFKPVGSAYAAGTVMNTWGGNVGFVAVTAAAGVLILPTFTLNDTKQAVFSITWDTTEAWPTSLPGTAA
jgi:hypothetical protein